VGGVSPKILYHHQPDRIWFAGGHFSSFRGLGLHWREGEDDDPREEGIREITFMTGACCLLSAAALGELGGFDEGFFAYVEDAELSVRMRAAGYRMLYQPTARILHHSPPPGAPPTPFQIRQRDRNRRKLMGLHFSPARRLPFLARFYLTRAALLLRYGVTGDGQRARAILQGMWGPGE
jgi:GT2 family glycosyltransferase